MPFLLVRYYVLPYQRATGTLKPDGGIDWLAGEALVAMSWCAVYVTLGVIAAVVIRREYDRKEPKVAAASA